MRRACGRCRHGAKRLAHHARDVGGLLDHRVPFGQRAHQRVLIDLGQGVFAVGGDGYISGDAQHGMRAVIGLDQAGQDIGGTTARRPFTHANPSGDAGIGVGHIGGAALVAGQHMGHAMIQPTHSIIKW